jgi:hypothetical protein
MKGDRRGRERMVVGFTTTYVINIYHHLSCEFESHSWRGVLDTTLCDKIPLSGLRQVEDSIRFPSPIKLTATI